MWILLFLYFLSLSHTRFSWWHTPIFPPEYMYIIEIHHFAASQGISTKISSKPEKKLHKEHVFLSIAVPTADVYQMPNVKIVLCNNKKNENETETQNRVIETEHIFCGAYNNVHKLSIHFIALLENLLPLFHHLPHILCFRLFQSAPAASLYCRFNPFLFEFAAGCRFFPRCHFMYYVYVCVGFALKSFILVLSAHSCETWKQNNNQKKYIRIFRLALSFGFYRTAMMMEMQMRWHNHSNLIHSIDLKQNLFETKDLCAITQFDMQMKIYQSMFLNSTVMYRIKGQRNGIYIDCELLFHLYYKIHFVVVFFPHLTVCYAENPLHSMVEFVIYGLYLVCIAPA